MKMSPAPSFFQSHAIEDKKIKEAFTSLTIILQHFHLQNVSKYILKTNPFGINFGAAPLW